MDIKMIEFTYLLYVFTWLLITIDLTFGETSHDLLSSKKTYIEFLMAETVAENEVFKVNFYHACPATTSRIKISTRKPTGNPRENPTAEQVNHAKSKGSQQFSPVCCAIGYIDDETIPTRLSIFEMYFHAKRKSGCCKSNKSVNPGFTDLRIYAINPV
ncbi:hypothetical protein M5K25_025553 [Dendrobium thyrsiflorum]|uniref:Uncharacterized protein n=1 Tax=Dendrobium thyrsiflorum TaxID=117978 RepID=A0ABD0U4I2_DENTH